MGEGDEVSDRMNRIEKTVLIVLFLCLVAGGMVRSRQRSCCPVAVSVSSFSREDICGASSDDLPRVRRRMVNINTADSEGLMGLRGVGRTLADRIVEYRAANGRFSSVDDLSKVRGVGRKVLTENRDILQVNESE